MQFCVTRVILRDLAALVPQIFHSLHKITHFLTGYINSYYQYRKIRLFENHTKNVWVLFKKTKLVAIAAKQKKIGTN
jgi:hypothetical protein